jgi:dipeptidyl aminopeptidase/acylaminoacyl peptidase
MTAHDDLDRMLLRWLDDPYTPPAPRYLPEVLERTKRTRQRKAWASLERWLPMAITLRRPVAVPTRLLALGAVLLIALLAVSAAVPVLTAPPPLPAVADPVTNGLIAIDRDGDIWTRDGVDGVERRLITGPEHDLLPDWSPDGTRIMFVRFVGEDPELMVADSDGSNVRSLSGGPLVSLMAAAWAPDSQRIAVVAVAPDARAQTHVLLADTNDGTLMDLGVGATDVAWSPDGDALLIRTALPDELALRILSLDDGSLSAPIALPAEGSPVDTELENPAWSPDGTIVSYVSGVAVDGTPQPRIHLGSLDGTAPLMVVVDPTSEERGGVFSPDGRWLAVSSALDEAVRPVLIPVDGGMEPIIGDPFDADDVELVGTEWAPDGSSVVVVSDPHGLVGSMDPGTGETTTQPWTVDLGLSWQRGS